MPLLPRMRLALALLVFIAVLASPAHAFDGRREGFVLGAAGGYGWLWAPTFDGSQEGHGLASRLEIGVGITDQWMIHYAGKQIFNFPDGYTQVLPAIGATYYVQDAAPSPFLTGGGGVGLFSGFDSDDLRGGFTMFGGVGYEFVRHWNVEVDYVSMFDTSGGAGAETTHTVLITVGALAY